MAALTDTRVLTAEEYAHLPEVIGFRDELIEGERVMSPTAQLSHSLVIKNLEGVLVHQGQETEVLRESGWYFQSPSGKQSVPEPDLMVVKTADVEQCVATGEKWFTGKPLFVIEVISPSERKGNRLQKVGLYLEAGAGAVVEIDLGKRLILVHTVEDDLPKVIREKRIDWPFVATFDQIFARLG